jgi:predicted dehydrogenase
MGLRVGIVGCGLIGRKRAENLRAFDELMGVTDVDALAAHELAQALNVPAYPDLDALLENGADVVIAAVTHDQLAGVAERALAAGAHVLVEKPAALGTQQIDQIAAAALASGRRVKVGFNHRFHPGIERLAHEVHSGNHGDLLSVRGRYGHGGRVGYEREWRMQPERSGGGELVDQGMHLLDLVHWLAGPLPLHSALLRTQFWEVPVEDNAALLLGNGADRSAPWAMIHVTWTEWKNMFSLEVFCRSGKLMVDGLARSYGPQRLRIYRMGPQLGPPSLEEISFPEADVSWSHEWEHFAAAIADGSPLQGDLDDARYAWSIVEQAYADGPYHATLAERA